MARLPWEITKEMFLSPAEVGRLLKHVRAPAGPGDGRTNPAVRLDRLIIESLLFSGLRTSEFCGLSLADTPAGRGESVFVVRAPRKGSRTVHLPRHLTRLIRGFAGRTRPELLPEDVAPDDLEQPLVFNERRNPYERTGLYRRVKRILTDAGLGDRASVQLLRHTYGFLAYRNTGGNLLFVQRQLGHAHPMITSVYARLVDESYPAMADLVYDGSGEATPARRKASLNRQPHGVKP